MLRRASPDEECKKRKIVQDNTRFEFAGNLSGKFKAIGINARSPI
jgi:hypothetical protein